jgi:hypothetical protein
MDATFADLRGPALGLQPIVWVAILLSVFQQAVGINVIFYYSSALWQQVGFSEADALTITVITSVTNIVVTLIAIGTIDRVGRRALLLVGSAGMSLSLGALAAVFATARVEGGEPGPGDLPCRPIAGEVRRPHPQPAATSRSTSSPRCTSANLVLSGDSPSRSPSGARKSGITPRATSLALSSRASPRHSVTWPPRRAGSRGEAMPNPSGTSHASASSTAYCVSSTDLLRTAAIPASSRTSRPASSGTIARIGGVPLRTARMPGAAS